MTETESFGRLPVMSHLFPLECMKFEGFVFRVCRKKAACLSLSSKPATRISIASKKKGSSRSSSRRLKTDVTRHWLSISVFFRAIFHQDAPFSWYSYVWRRNLNWMRFRSICGLQDKLRHIYVSHLEPFPTLRWRWCRLLGSLSDTELTI